MPTFEITSPDGKTWEVTAPEGATQEQVLAYAKGQWKGQESKPDPVSALGSDWENFKAGAGKSIADVGRRAAQLYRQAGFLPGQAGPLQGMVADRLGMPNQQDIDAAKAHDAELMGTKAGLAGAVAGMLPAAVATAPITGPSIAGSGAAGAATSFLTQPVASDENPLLGPAIGAVAGVGGSLLGRGVKALVGAGKGLLEPFYEKGQQKIAGRVLERFSENPEALKIASGAATQTGALPTLAEASRDRGIASLERALGQQEPQIASSLAQRSSENNAARVRVLQDLAGNEARRAAAMEARDTAAGQMYKAATSASYTVDDKLAELLKRPVVRQAMERAKTLAQNQGRQFSFEVSPPNAFAGLGVPNNTSRQITGQGLQDLKMALDEMLTDPQSGFAGKAGDAVKGLRSQIVSWMEQANPGFKSARESYASLSKPINAMDVGQRVLDKTTASIRDLNGNPRILANSFSRALNDEKSLVRNATGFKGVKSLEDVLSPEQIASLNAVRGEMELGANLANAANGPGSQTAKSLASQNLMRQILGPTGMPQSWAESAVLQTALRPVQFGMQAAEPKVQGQLLKAMLEPEYAKTLLEAANPTQRAQLVKLLTDPALIRILRGSPVAAALATQNGRE